MWVNDKIQALVTELDPSLRHINLSIKGMLRQMRKEYIRASEERRKESPLEDLLDSEIKERLYSTSTQDLQQKVIIQPKRISRILIIDDNVDFGNPLVEWFKHKGYDTQLATTGNEGLALLSKQNFNLIFLDAHLPDTNGINVAEIVQNNHPQVNIILITGYEQDLNIDQASQMGIPFFYKPLSEHDLREIVTHFEENRPLSLVQPESGTKKRNFLDNGLQAIAERKPIEQIIGSILDELSELTATNSIAVFCLDTRKREIRLMMSRDVPQLTDEHIHNFIYSPIRDVAEDGITLLENQINPRRFKYLLNWFDFQSCIGVPIYNIYGDEKYSLFIFSPIPSFFSSEIAAHSRATATLIGAALSFKHTENEILQAQQLILRGQLGAGLLHEVNNRLGGALIHVKNISEELADQRKQIKVDLNEIKTELKELEKNLSNISASVHLFRKLSRVKSWEKIDINLSIRQNINLMEPLATKYRVEIESDLQNNIPKIDSIKIRIDQVICNIMLNALEWMRYIPAAKLVVETQYHPDNNSLPVQIRFKDRALGIHRNLFEKIFDLGFSTREGGTGLGLFISEGLIKSIGGKVSVEESIILIGSTFLVELPLENPFSHKEEKNEQN